MSIKNILSELKGQTTEDNLEIEKEINEIMKIKNGKNFDDDSEFSIILKAKRCEADINSIFFFFNYFPKDEKWNEYLSPKYKDLSTNGPDNIKLYLTFVLLFEK